MNSQVSGSGHDETLENLPSRQSHALSDRHGKVSAEASADGFAIGINQARATSKAAHQKGTRSVILPLGRRHREDQQCLGKRLNAEFATDASCFKKKSLTMNVGCQTFSHESRFDAVHHIPKSDNDCIGDAFKDFMSNCSAPEHPTMDGAAVQVGRHATFQKLL